MSPPNCTLCCSKCRGNASAGSSRVRKDTNPYEVYCNFLPAGTVTIPLQSGEVTCSHTHAADGWHYLPSAVALEPTLVPNDAPLLRLRQLEFLVKHRFIAATCKLDHISNVLYVRVYLIPWDLPGAHGELRVRNEVSVVVPARRHLRSLLAEIIQDDDAWDALPPQDVVPEAEATTLKQRHFLTDDTDNRTMAEIYNDLRSPKPPAKFRIYKIADMRSVLYTYQKETVATMLAWELEPSSAADPLYIPITGIDGAVFYLQPETFEIQQECPRVVQTRGGILCEELGTGKTIMILGLILATRNQLSSPAESILDPRPVLTPLSLRHFPTGEEAQARERLLQGRGSSARLHTHANRAEPNTIPSLVEHLLHYCAVRPDAVQLWQHQEQLEQRDLWKPIIRNSPFYHHYEVAIPGVSRSKRKESNPGPRVMYLSAATIVLVPDNLFHQWKGEIMKHCHDVLRVLEVTSRKLPHAAKLASDYDIVLMTYHSFSLEAAANKVHELHSWKVCECPRHRRTRVPDCTCSANGDASKVSPLLQVRWKRLVIDEGHVSANKNSNLITLSRVLSVERKWIVTGTPTPNLLGLHHGQGSELQYPEDPDEPNTESTDEELSARRWTPDDRQDLNKLSTMMVHFLGVPQFATDPKLFERLVISPLMARSGPRTGAIQVLTQVMETMMIRHRVEDIENDVLLPLLNRETVLLDLDPYALMSYNAMQAMIAVNAVDSERKDQDYLFHPANAAPLNQLVDNMSQVMFWHVDDQSSFNVDEIAGRAKVFMANLAERGTSEADRVLMEQALKHVGLAANNIVWRQMQRNAFVYHRIQGIPDPAVYRAWTTFASSAADNLAGHDMMLHSDRALRFKQFVLRHPLYSVDRLVLGGKDVQEEERQRLALQRMEDARKKKRKRKSEGSAHRKEVETVKHVVATPEKREELRKEYLASWEKLQKHYEQDDEHAHSQSGSAPARPKTTSSWLLASSPMASVRVGKSTSTKLDYIINEIRQHSADEKFLIFSRSPLTLAYVSEGLELMGMKYLQFTTKVPREQRQHNIVTFETSELYRVFLMELQHGARGLNLIAASRVIFCEPVWQADVESQAIKRVHRIGQKRPVTVKTLAIRSTHEEVMVSRRDALLQSGAGAVKQPKLTEDTRIRDFIANPTFLSETSNPRLEIDFPLFDIQPPEPEVALEASRSLNGVQPTGTADPHARDVVVVNSTNQRPGAEPEASGSKEEPPRKKVRVVRF
ncbi:P-loop containing nucleoside triphosphate hydrolase protein [Rhodofomes roseus]|uniref:P-loop containing nucleoside triphosphate hydrolase protein n=1 Tax=Rhodofomes roseus TaxID=34475 RepID=A0ABQ8K6M5_9APHY|nr:P-loop containing nucleoside triphosphate hydrolase protein [Rhodofomes roseus]KAH9832900.1 P-loop containing nucleoside triphosphate hydrolase protein [Rhodofomes roseus]